MRFVQILVGSFLILTTSCNTSYIVTSSDKVVSNADKQDLGLAGTWKSLQQPDEMNDESEIRIEGPNPEGIYMVEFLGTHQSDQALLGRFTVEPILKHSSYLLVEATFAERQEIEEPVYYLAYLAIRKEHVHLGHISMDELRKRLTASDINAVIEYSWPFVRISEHAGGLRKVLCDDPKSLVSTSVAYVRN
jgi:hypothetical protein